MLKKTKRSAAFLLAVVLLVLSIDVKKTYANPIAIVPELLSLYGTMMAAGGVMFGSEQDIERSMQGMALQDQTWLYDFARMGEMATTFETVAGETAIKISLFELASLYARASINLADYFIENAGGGIVDSSMDGSIIGYTKGYAIANAASISKTSGNESGDPQAIRKKYKSIINAMAGKTISYNGHVGKITDGTYINNLEQYTVTFNGNVTSGGNKIDADLCFSMYEIGATTYIGTVYLQESPGRLTISYKMLTAMSSSTVADIGVVKPFVADVAPINLIQDTAAAVANVASLGGATAETDEIGLVVPASVAAVVGATAFDVVRPIAGTINPPVPTPGDGTGVDDPPVYIPPMTGNPAVDLPVIGDVLGEILGVVNGIKARVIAIPGTIAELGEQVVALPDTIAGAVTTAIAADVALDFEPVQKNTPDLSQYFPFCIPFDLARAVKDMNASGKPPKFSIDLSGTVFNYKWELDFGEYEELAHIIRWGVWMSVLVGLMLATSKLIKW